MQPKNHIWTEKYRPKNVSELVGDFKDKISKYLADPESVPNFLFHSTTGGTGKTTLSKAIINELECDALILNSSDERKIEVIREKVKEFAMTTSSNGKRKAVFLDEFDGMLKNSQDALRNIMETYSANIFFILTANNINKIIGPIQNRCVVIPFAYPKREEIKEYLEKICIAENLDYTDEGIVEIVNKNYPSIRSCVITLQDLHTENLPVIPNNIKRAEQIFEDLWQLLKAKDIKQIKKTVIESSVEARELNTYIWYKAAEEDNIRLIQLTCLNEKTMATGADSKIIFVSSLFEMVK